jgi:hypothetical protein
VPDMIQPVGAMVKVPDPTQGINTMSGILGLQQQKQALTQGQQQIQANTMANTGTAMSLGERQRVQQILSSGVDDQGNSIKDEDGTPDPDKAMKWMPRVAPTTYPTYLKGIQETEANKLGLKNTTADLGQKYRDQIGGMLQSGVNDPSFNSQKAAALLVPYGAQNPDAAPAITHALSLLKNMDNVNSGDPKADLAKKNDMLVHTIQAFKPSQANQPSTVDTGPTIQPGSTQPLTGQFTPSGPGIQKGLSPTDQPSYKRQAAAAGTEGTAGAANDEDLYNTITQRGTQATKLKSLTQDISSLAGEVQTGQYSKAFADKWSALKQTFGFRPDDNSADTKRQILTKMAAQLKAASESGATTDSARAGIEASLPDPEHMGPAAVQQAARYVGSLADIDTARSRLAQQHRQVSGGQSTGLRAADSAFMQNADPKVFEYQNIPAGQERQNYLKQHFKSKDEVKAFLDKQQALRGYGAIQ